MDITSAFLGITAPLNELYDQIGSYGWEPKSVKWDKKLGQYVAEAQNSYGETIAKVGPDETTAVAHLLAGISRHHHMRTAAQWKLGMWKTQFTDQLEHIAEEYAKAPIYDPKAAAAFKELGDDSLRRCEILGHQLEIEITDDPTPYQTAAKMIEDIHKKKHVLVTRANLEHPVWSPEQHIAFRAVHDVLGFAVSGGEFNWQGENLACSAHFPLLTPNAQLALFTQSIARSAYMEYYRALGPEKVAIFPKLLSHAQKEENPGPGHRGVHPSQSIAPVKMPGLNDGEGKKGEPSAVGDFVSAPAFSLSKVASDAMIDPNAGWQSGQQPMTLQTHGVGNAYLDHGDPLDANAVMDNAALIDSKWHSLTKGDGSFDRDRAKLAICNAFRVVLLSPRKDLRWNAAHYQDIAHIPATTDDPKVYWDALESARRNWNESQGIDPNAHMIYFKFLKPFESVMHQLHPELGFEGARKKAEEVLFDWWTEEQQRIMADDEKKPSDKQRSADEIERRANEALAKRMKAYLSDKFNQKTDVQADEPAPMSLFGHTSAEQYNLLTGQPALKYGAFMGTHLKSISQISQHADEILDAAMEDVRSHDAAGHHFRSKVLQLGISGVGPKVCSFAWLLLQPLTSQLGTIDTHMMDVLGHNYEKEMNNRDYFKFERELAAGRDAAGYGHVPLGAFQWGMWDHKRTGPGSHQDHSAMAVLDPKPHTAIDWASKAQNLKGESWLNQAPDWWRNTQNAREEVGQDWDKNVAPNWAQGNIPFQVAPQVLSKVAGKGQEFHVGFAVPDRIVNALMKIAFDLGLEDPEDPSEYHMTAMYSPQGFDNADHHEWIRSKGPLAFDMTNARLDAFPSHDDKGFAIVMRFDSVPARKFVAKLLDEAEDRGLEVSRFDGGYKPHITLGWAKEKGPKGSYDLDFQTGSAYVSLPREVKQAAKEYRPTARMAAGPTAAPWFEVDGQRQDGKPGQTIMQHAQKLGLPTTEIWRLLGESAGKHGDSIGTGELGLRDQVWPLGEGMPTTA